MTLERNSSDTIQTTTTQSPNMLLDRSVVKGHISLMILNYFDRSEAKRKIVMNSENTEI